MTIDSLRAVAMTTSSMSGRVLVVKLPETPLFTYLSIQPLLSVYVSVSVRFSFRSQHQAAVKGMAWCPWQSRLLATGGGTNDRSIKLWNMNIGDCVDTIDTKSQVSGIFWNSEYQEIISSHGFPNHTLQIWKYPTKAKVIAFIYYFYCQTFHQL